MKPFRLALLTLCFAGAVLSVARAQFIRIEFSDPVNSQLLFRATSAAIPWDHSVGWMTKLDLYFDPAAAVSDGAGLHTFSAGSAFWRAQVETFGLGNFVFARPLENLQVNGSLLSFEYYNEATLDEFDFFAEFTADISVDNALPTSSLPPIALGDESLTGFTFWGGPGIFDVPDFAEGYGYGSFQSAVLHPIPEPSTYALGALALLGLAVVHRRRRHRLEKPAATRAAAA